MSDKQVDTGQTPAGRVALRNSAEARVRLMDLTSHLAKTPEEIQRAFHDLHVHQIELQTQNEELRSVQSALEENQARYFELYDLAPVGYCTLSEEGRILDINLTAARLLGVARTASIKQPFFRFILKEDQDIHYLHRKKLFETSEPQECELRLVKSNGTTFWAHLTAYAAAAQDGSRVCRVALSNIDDRKQAEQEKSRLLEMLAQAQKMEAIGALAGGVAHDFNNILSGLMGGLSLLELDLGEVGDRHRDDIEGMKGLVQRGAELSRQLLGFGRRGKYDVVPRDAREVVRKTAELFGQTHRDITLVLDFDSDLDMALVDHPQLEQVLLNLFINAAHAMPNGGRLTVRGENATLGAAQSEPHGAKPGRFVKLVVADTGTGIDPAILPRVFEPFFTTRGLGLGTGLGLASAYGIVKNHGGVITVESEVGKGTAFTVLFPATDRRPAGRPATTAVQRPVQGTILVVDDEPVVLRVCAALLRAVGYEVLTASRGRTAVDLVRQHRHEIALVILDTTMPEMSGADTFDAIREVAPELKVLLASGFAVEGQAQALLDRGCSGFIQKPFGLASLLDKLQSLR
ncbi:MAG: response regulator [Polyangiaceae bacterium]|jgi:PAS domain S-box-containing protein|nr:response regulator [Polyangiaceae bacterium]